MRFRPTFLAHLLATVVTVFGLARVGQAQCFLDRLFNRPTTYAAGYGGYPVGVAYTPVTTYMPVVGPPGGSPVTAYRVIYLPVTPGATTVYRVAPAISPPVVSTTSYLPVATPYAASPSAPATTLVPTITYRPVQIVYEPRRLFPWRPFANLRARRLGYVAATTPTWTTAYFATYAYMPVSTTSVACAPETMLLASASVPSLEGTASGCLGCAAAPAGISPGWAAYTVPSLPSTSTPSGTQPIPTFKQESGTSPGESRLKPPEEGKSGPSTSGTSLPVSQDRPLVRQALYEKPIPLVDEEADPPMVDVQGWRRVR